MKLLWRQNILDELRPYEVEDYARGIVLLLSDPKKRAEMGKNTWEHVKKNFSWDYHVDILEKEIERILKS